MSMHFQYASGRGFRRRRFLAATFGGLLSILGSLPGVTVAQDDPCSGLLFSTSEDFLTRGPAPADGNPIISDGDLLAWHVSAGARICRRNADLIRRFDIARVDLGLDAVASVDENRRLIAFSTELDSPNGDQFTAGDLLFTTGGIIPNAALLSQFNTPRSLDLGLDAVTLVGEEDRLRRLAAIARNGTFQDDPEQLAGFLKELDIDIWFSTEGTPPEIGKPLFLDGDLLSARDGVIVRSNASLLPALPAGIPVRGVDFGLDAFTPALDPIENVPVELMSTEIVGFGPTPFTDGDVLQPGPAIWLKAGDLLKNLEPASRDLGLDALHDNIGDVAQCAPPSITFISGVEVGVIDPTTGLGDWGGVAQRPFAGDIRIQGSMPEVVNCPNLALYEYRVEIDQGAGFPTFADPGVVHMASDNWRRMVRPTPFSPCPISRNDTYDSDALGWFAVTDYRRFDGCGDPPSLAVWDSTTGASNALVRVRLVMREIGAATPTYVSGAVRVQIDNDRISLPDNLLQTSSGTGDMWFDIYRASETSPLGDQCKVEGEGEDVVLDMKGRINDDHFWKYDLRWSGGFVVGAHMITDATDQTHFDDGRADLNSTGTQPPASILIPLKTGFDLTAAYATVAAAQSVPTALPDVCGFTVHFRAWDRAVQLNFVPGNNHFSPVSRHTTMWRSFCVSR
ncbi:hypothetical protein [Yoonia sediminilitoris]|uniref:Uncharacterized protein n=1 Tax=Yoonia sediminilitoris TaxID=1286148 RepID=A0A2T6KC05_9RHOB|nr:hypothetical protein [Yoonia sediminilitoris]PUB12451.1 hypothetical protein C8N45_11090 [Yoonia sediminilitoris]RCW93145.1 hypothetical protein DFP92_11090 [Yoonia sediminilitoris]